MPEGTTTKRKPADTKPSAGEQLAQDLAQKVKDLQEQLELLKFSASQLESARANDPMEQSRKAREIVDRSREPRQGKNTWLVYVPGFVAPVSFKSDADSEQAAIREYEMRFGTVFNTRSQRESDNHRIEKEPA